MRKTILNIPAEAGCTPDHFSTWWAQENAPRTDDPRPSGNLDAIRDNLNHDALFGSNGWANTFYPLVRKDLYLTICDGWELPDTAFSSRLLDTGCFGSQILDEGKFPGYGDTPAERLKTFVKKTKNAGWKGAGLWICAQEDDAHRSERYDLQYWRERLQWSAYAGIEYWEVDWGRHCGDIEFRRFLTQTARELCPELTVEHILGCGGLNDEFGTGRAPEEMMHQWKKVASFSDVFRSYDVTTQLTVSTTLDRIAALLRYDLPLSDGAKGLICGEDQLSISASLGMTSMVMRNPFGTSEIDEVSRALRYKRLAPAFSGCELKTSSVISGDRWHFHGDTWYAPVDGKTVTQFAPLVIARGDIPLPEVHTEEKPPFVTASLHPNGCFALCTLGRTDIDRQNDLMPCKNAEICVSLPDSWNGVIAVFGYVRNLCIRLPSIPKTFKIYAQDLLEDTPQLFDDYSVCGDYILIDGQQLAKIGLRAASAADTSVPGVLLNFITEE